MNQKHKGEDNNKHQENKSNHKGPLWKPIFKSIRKYRRNGQFLDTYNHLEMKQNEINHLNRSIHSMKLKQQ
jgi:hypothetical protein